MTAARQWNRRLSIDLMIRSCRPRQ